MASKDRKAVARKIKEHIADVTKPPLLVFPEGTCVNNEYAIMFKRGAFELGDCICPVAIKYNKIFVDGYWNSREQSFPMHIFNFLVSWALVVEVTYMDPQFRLRGESSTSFATRVKAMIAKEAGLQTVPWDGYLKYFQPKPEYKKNRQKIYAKMLRQRFNLGPSECAPACAWRRRRWRRCWCRCRFLRCHLCLRRAAGGGCVCEIISCADLRGVRAACAMQFPELLFAMVDARAVPCYAVLCRARSS